MTIDWTLLIEWLVKSVISIAVMLAGFAYMTWAERKVAAKLQTRIGPNRRGPFGLLFPVADGIKLIFKEETIPNGADRLIFILAPIITVVPALVVMAVIPWGPAVMVPWVFTVAFDCQPWAGARGPRCRWSVWAGVPGGCCR